MKKKKLLSLLVAICLVIPVMFMLVACGDKGNKNPPAPNKISFKVTMPRDMIYGEDSCEYQFSGAQSYGESNSNVESQFTFEIEEGKKLTLTLRPKLHLNYTEEDLSITEENNKTVDYEVEITNNSMVSKVIKIVVSNIEEGMNIKVALTNEGVEPIRVDMPFEFSYDITAGTGKAEYAEALTQELKETIRVYSDEAEDWVSVASIANSGEKYADFLAAYNLYTYEEAVAKYDELKEAGTNLSAYVNPRLTKSVLKNVDVNNFKVYVTFGNDGFVKYTDELLEDLVAFKNVNDIYDSIVARLIFNPEPVIYKGVKCYEYSLRSTDMTCIDPDYYLAISYNGTTYDSSVSSKDGLAKKLGIVGETYRFGSFYYTAKVGGYTLGFSIDDYQYAGEERKSFNYSYFKDISKEMKIFITHSENDFVDFSKIKVMLGNTYASYDEETKTYTLTIPANKYPSEYGNAYKYQLKIQTLSNPEEMLKPTANVFKYTVSVTEEEYFDIVTLPENISSEGMELFDIIASADGKSKTVKMLSQESSSGLIPVGLDFNYTNYDVIVIDIIIGELKFENVTINLLELGKLMKSQGFTPNYLKHEAGKSSYILHTEAVYEVDSTDGYVYASIRYYGSRATLDVMGCWSGNNVDNTSKDTPISINIKSVTAATVKLSAKATLSEGGTTTDVNVTAFEIEDSNGNALVAENGVFTLTVGKTYKVRVKTDEISTPFNCGIMITDKNGHHVNYEEFSNYFEELYEHIRDLTIVSKYEEGIAEEVVFHVEYRKDL